MHFFPTHAALVALSALVVSAHAAEGPLAALRWKARPIVVLSDASDDPRVGRQISAFDRAKPELDERDIQVLQEARPGSTLRKRLGVAARGFAVVLVGKDGSVKKIWRDPVDPKEIFGLIDQMPMRREEMRGGRCEADDKGLTPRGNPVYATDYSPSGPRSRSMEFSG